MPAISLERTMRRIIICIILGGALWFAFSVLQIMFHSRYPLHAEQEHVWTDLLSIAVASTLYQIDRGPPLSSLADLTGGPNAYLGVVPADPYRSDKGPFETLREGHGAISHVYSLGPDRDDDRCRTQYDPTNGAQSNGDIFAERDGAIWMLPWWEREWQKHVVSVRVPKEMVSKLSPEGHFVIAPDRREKRRSQ